MVITRQPSASTRAFLLVDLMVAMAILMIAFFPLAYSFTADARLFRATYQQAVAMEIVDGEMEILAAGAWRAYPEGTQSYPIHARAAQNLPEGKFQLTRTGNHLRLEWDPAQKTGVGIIAREVTIQ